MMLTMPLRPITAVALGVTCLGALPSLAAAQEPVLGPLLVIERVGLGGRSPIFTDAIEAQLVHGTWKAPRAGDTIATPFGRDRTWRRLEGDGDFRDNALRAGWALATIEVPTERIVLLDARGHRHVYVNGVPRGGDVYDLGFTRLPVLLHAGSNELLFKGGRGRLRAVLEAPPGPVFFEPRDRTLTDVVRGPGGPRWLGLIVTNATRRWQTGLEIVASGPDIGSTATALPPLPPMASRKVAVEFEPPTAPAGDKVALALSLREGERALDTTELELAVRAPEDKHVRSYRSGIDGSAQYFGVTPQRTVEPQPGRPALFLSLHGAGVEAGHQARCYDHKDQGHIIAPTNRRRFGFDWEDWGRLDALEALAEAERIYDTDPRRTYLTGHSMGGHGTWHIGAHFPDRFAAIAPSAGWRDFNAYGGGRGSEREDEPTPLEELCDRAANASRTLLLAPNYAHHGVYVLHGDADRTVSVEQARFMRGELAEFHTNFAYYEQPGAGHWWGNQCMDWPALFEFLQRNVRAAPRDVRQVQFTTVNPGISARCDWVTVEAQQQSMQPSRVDASLDADKRTVTAVTANVARLAFDLAVFAKPGTPADETVLPADEPLAVVLDDQELDDIAWPEAGVVRLTRGTDGIWQTTGPAPARHKGPHRAGPFKDAFRHDMVFVVGTAGTPEEDTWALQKARYDAETFQYRGNGSADIVLDSAFDPTAYLDRNVILYGNADTNAAWPTVLGACPIEVRRQAVRVGDRRIAGDGLACLFVYPRQDSDVASVGVVAGTGAVGQRLTHQLPYFISGVAYPDWIVLGSEMLERGADGVRGAGFFGPDWSLERGDAAWR